MTTRKVPKAKLLAISALICVLLVPASVARQADSTVDSKEPAQASLHEWLADNEGCSEIERTACFLAGVIACFPLPPVSHDCNRDPFTGEITCTWDCF